MKSKKISISITPEHPSYQWAKKQSDSINAFGHIGTHIDCYESIPPFETYEVDAVVIDCKEGMPSISDIELLSVHQKAVLLYTGNMDKNSYGSREYGEMNTIMTETVLDSLLEMKPAFIVIDSYGIGSHGEEHINFDKKCELINCFVIENVSLSKNVSTNIVKLKISFDKNSTSTGKPCEVVAFLV